MFEIVRQIGKLIRRNDATKSRDKIQFARVMLEVSMTQNLPNQISFMNGHRNMVNVENSI